MAKDKLTDYSATNASNTDVGGINIDEGMLPSAVNNSIRELMTHLKEFSDGTSGIDILSLADDDASASIKFQAPAAVTTTVTFTLPDGDGADGQALITNGSGTLAWAYPYGNRNVLINGNFDVWQRSTSFTDVAGIWKYGHADRWNGHNDGTDAGTWSQSTTVPNSGSKYSLLMTGATSVTNTNTSQRIESVNLQGIRAANSMTLSGYVRSETAGKVINLHGLCPTATDNYSSYTQHNNMFSSVTIDGDGTTGSSSITLTSANTWYYFTATKTSVTSLTNFDKGYALFCSVVGQSSSSEKVYFSQFQIEAGEQATPFDHSESYGETLAKCQRYFQVAQTKVGLAGTTNGSTEVVYIGVPLNVALRAAPSLSGPTSYAARNTSVASGSTNTPTARWDNANSCMLSIDQTGFSGFTDNRFACLHFSGGDLKMDAEL